MCTTAKSIGRGPLRVISAILRHFAHVRFSTDRVKDSDRKNFGLGMNPQRCRRCTQLRTIRAVREIMLGARLRHASKREAANRGGLCASAKLAGVPIQEAQSLLIELSRTLINGSVRAGLEYD